MHTMSMTMNTQTPAKCTTCGNEYNKIKSWQKFCNQKCRNLNKRNPGELKTLFQKTATDMENLDYSEKARIIADIIDTDNHYTKLSYTLGDMNLKIEVGAVRNSTAIEFQDPADLKSQDSLNILKSKLEYTVSRAEVILDKILAKHIANPGLCYDAEEMFSNMHPVNAINPALGTYSNILEDNRLDDMGLLTALDTLIKNSGAKKVLIVVPNRRMQDAALKLLNGEYVSNTNGKLSTSGIIDVLMLPELNAYSFRDWYLVDISKEEKPFAITVLQKPEFIYSGLEPTDFIRLDKGEIGWRWGYNIGIGNVFPQLIIKSTEPAQ